MAIGLLSFQDIKIGELQIAQVIMTIKVNVVVKGEQIVGKQAAVIFRLPLSPFRTKSTKSQRCFVDRKSPNVFKLRVSVFLSPTLL